ncbi:HET-domain-containing protein [Colletotrichum falcatum]|nr:HET-domain-containing protein [Colletotrichum falcatum]
MSSSRPNDDVQRFRVHVVPLDNFENLDAVSEWMCSSLSRYFQSLEEVTSQTTCSDELNISSSIVAITSPPIEDVVQYWGGPDLVCSVCVKLFRDLAVFSLDWNGETYVAWGVTLRDLADATEKGCPFCAYFAVLFFSLPHTSLNGNVHVPINIFGTCCGKVPPAGIRVSQALSTLRGYEEASPGVSLAFVCQPVDYDRATKKFGLLRLQSVKVGEGIDDRSRFPTFRDQVTLEVYATPENPMSQHLKYQPIDMRPGSASSLENTRLWLEDCIHNHEGCMSMRPVMTKLPARLIGILNEKDLRLVEGVNEGYYTALSYCWGKSRTFVAKRQTLHSLKAGFDISKLPLSIQHGIAVTHSLGIKYIWVDALCIIQDDADDKVKEIPKMAPYYQNAYLTLAAGGPTCDSGFLTVSGLCEDHSDEPIPRDLMEMPILCANSRSKGRILFRQKWPYNMSTEPISRRAWTFQERILSPRVVQYGERVVWMCNSKQMSAGGFEDWSSDARSAGNRRLEVDLREMFEKLPPVAESPSPHPKDGNAKAALEAWYKAVEEFSCRELTNSNDKLPAISGLAMQIQRSISGHYAAGIWKEDLLGGLLWSVAPAIFPQKSSPKRAPSWSWACCDNAVSYKKRSEIDGMCCVGQVLACDAPPKASLAPLGEVSVESCEITLIAPLLPIDSGAKIKTVLLDESMISVVRPSTLTDSGVQKNLIDELHTSNFGHLPDMRNWEPPQGCRLAILFLGQEDVAESPSSSSGEARTMEREKDAQDTDEKLWLGILNLDENLGESLQDSPGFEDYNLSSPLLAVAHGNDMTDFDPTKRGEWKVKKKLTYVGLVLAPTEDGKYERLAAFTDTMETKRDLMFPTDTFTLV